MVLVTKPMFWDMGNHLGPFSEASDRPGGQELGRGAVGGQDRTGQDILFVLSIVNEQWFESNDDRLGIATQKR